jgi:PqqD family protein of HPr-rel-A system
MSEPPSIKGHLQRSEVDSYPLDDDLVIYHQATREGFILNGTAKRIWELADGTNTLATIARILTRDYGIAYDQARADAAELLIELRRAGLITTAKNSRGGRG